MDGDSSGGGGTLTTSSKHGYEEYTAKELKDVLKSRGLKVAWGDVAILKKIVL
jgi:hypothetical protein